MNASQLVQDCIDGKESCSNGAELILQEIRRLQTAFSEVVDGAVVELRENIVEDSPGAATIYHEGYTSDLFIKALESKSVYDPAFVKLDFTNPNFRNRKAGYAGLELNRSDSQFTKDLKFITQIRKYELYNPKR